MNAGRPRIEKPETRRQRGSGGVRQRDDGLYEGRISLTVNGKRERRTFYGKTKDDVEDRIRREISNWRDGKDTRPLATRKIDDSTDNLGNTTVGDWADAWLRDVRRIQVKATTYELDASNVRAHIKPHDISKVRLKDLTAARIDGLLADMARAGKSGRLQQVVRQTLGQMLDTARKRGYVKDNACLTSTKPTTPKTTAKCWESAEANTFFRIAEADRLYALFFLGALSGLRQGELLGLRWGDIEADWLKVAKSWSKCYEDRDGKVRMKYELRDTKTDQSVRPVPLLPEAAAVLEAHKALAQSRGRATPSDFVFQNGDGGALHPSNVRRSFDALIEKAGVKRIKFHELRHTYVTMLHGRGVDHEIAMKWTGHTDHRTHAGYNHVTTEREEAARKSAARFFPTVIRGGKAAA